MLVEVSAHFISVLLHKTEPFYRLKLIHKMSLEKLPYSLMCNHRKCHVFLQDEVCKHHKSIIMIPSIHHSLYCLNPCYLYHCYEWENDRAGSWGDKLSGDDSNAPHRRPITSNAQWKGEDVPDQDHCNVTTCLCISNTFAHENVYSGSMNQCWGEILIHFHLKFPFKFSICGC